MAESSIAKARRLAREKREKREREEAAPPPKKEEKEEKGFFDSFLNRGDAIDDAVEGRRKNQSTDSNNGR